MYTWSTGQLPAQSYGIPGHPNQMPNQYVSQSLTYPSGNTVQPPTYYDSQPASQIQQSPTPVLPQNAPQSQASYSPSDEGLNEDYKQRLLQKNKKFTAVKKNEVNLKKYKKKAQRQISQLKKEISESKNQPSDTTSKPRAATGRRPAVRRLPEPSIKREPATEQGFAIKEEPAAEQEPAMSHDPAVLRADNMKLQRENEHLKLCLETQTKYNKSQEGLIESLEKQVFSLEEDLKKLNEELQNSKDENRQLRARPENVQIT
ncbi:MAG: hypothetical protein Q9227_005254 [Pyrenula ochraceoflavens]